MSSIGIWAQMRGGGEVAGSQPMSTAVHRSPNKLWSSNSIYNLWDGVSIVPQLVLRGRVHNRESNLWRHRSQILSKSSPLLMHSHGALNTHFAWTMYSKYIFESFSPALISQHKTAYWRQTFVHKCGMWLHAPFTHTQALLRLVICAGQWDKEVVAGHIPLLV